MSRIAVSRRAREGPQPRCCPDPLPTTHLLSARPWCARCRREIAYHEYASPAAHVPAYELPHRYSPRRRREVQW